MASKKRELHESEEVERKKSKLNVQEIPEAKPKQRVVLNPADCNLDFNIEGNGLQGSDLHEEGFAYCWSGARANVGITGGKYCFGCKIVSNQPVIMEDTPPDQQHVCRVGISRGDDAVGNLGETEHSFGFGGTGKFSNAGKFSDYGENFGVGDTIVCAVNLEDKPLASIGFSKNGKWLGISKQFDAGSKGPAIINSPSRKLQWESAVYPHVLLKNVAVVVQFNVEEGLIPEEGYKPWSSALEDGNAVLGPTFSNIKDCEVMMMVGLPASGKTTWAEKWVKGHPEKRYVLLGTNLVLDQMKIPGLLRKSNYGERFERLMSQATVIFNTLLSRAAKTSRNYIIDQTNVYKNARKRKLKTFYNFRRIAVVIFPKPDELKIRAEKRFREMGKEVPDEAVMEMLANYVLPVSKDMPGSDDCFDQVLFPELNREESQKHLDEMKRASSSTSDMNIRSNNSQPCAGSSLQSRETPSVTSGPWQSSHSSIAPLQLNSEYGRPNQVDRRFEGCGLHGRNGSLSGPHSLPRDAPFGTYSGYSHGAHPYDSSPYSSYGSERAVLYEAPAASARGTYDSSPYTSYSTYESPVASARGTYSGYHGGADPYQNNEVGGPYRIPISESRGTVPGGTYDSNYGGMAMPYSSYTGERAGVYQPPLARGILRYGAQGGYHSSPQVPPRPSIYAPNDPVFLPSPASTGYGSPYAMPTPRPSGNPPDMQQQHFGVHSAPPRPW